MLSDGVRVVAIFMLTMLAATAATASQDGPAAPFGRPSAAARAESLQRVTERADLTGTLAEAIAQCAELAEVPIEVDWASLAETGVTAQTPVALQAAETTVARLLRLTLRQVAADGEPLSWYVDAEGVHVTTQANVSAHGPRGDSPDAEADLPPAPDETDQDDSSQPPTVRGQRIAELAYDQTPLGDVIDDIRLLTQANIAVNWPSLAEHDITPSTPVSLQLTDVSMATLLNVLTDDLSGGRGTFASVYWLVDDDGLIRIATGQALNRTLETHVYGIGDLLMDVPDFHGPRLDLDVSAQSRSLYSDGERGTGDDFHDPNRRIIDLVKGLLDEDMWQPEGEGSVSIIGDQLVITQTPLGWLLMRAQ